MFPNLLELYASYNHISDLSSIVYHSSLNVIDFEANLLNDISHIQDLSTINTLK